MPTAQEILKQYFGYDSFRPGQDELVQAIVRASRAAGLEPRFHRSGGGSDANVLAARGVRPVTLGVGMAAFHSVDEHIAVDDLEGAARLVEALIAEGAQ